LDNKISKGYNKDKGIQINNIRILRYRKYYRLNVGLCKLFY